MRFESMVSPFGLNRLAESICALGCGALFSFAAGVRMNCNVTTKPQRWFLGTYHGGKLRIFGIAELSERRTRAQQNSAF